MPAVTIRKCRFTGKLFESDEKFKKHLVSLRQEQAYNRERQRHIRGMGAVFTQMRSECSNAEQIAQFIKDNWNTFYANGERYLFRELKSGRPLPKVKLIDVSLDFKWGSFTYGHDTGLVSNSHRAPLTGPWAGKTNWGGLDTAKGIPKGYLGWSGSIQYTVDKDFPFFASSVFDRTGIFTGTGSSHGKNKYQYSIELYADDWPTLFANESKRKVKEIMGFME